MKIINLHIENFGTLHDFSLNLTDGLVNVCRENGFGKTTLASFIKAMFYGMVKKGNNKAYSVDRSKYKPWQGGVYGGQLTFQSEKGQFRIERTFAETPEGDTFNLIDLSTGLKSDRYSKNVGYDLFGVGVETFEITAFFPQLDLSCGINDEVRASLTGANKFENDLAGFADAQKIIAERIKVLKKLQVPKLELERLEQTKSELYAKLEALKEERNRLFAEVEQAKIKLNRMVLEADKVLAMREEIKNYNQEKSKLESEIFKLQEQVSELFTINAESEQTVKQTSKKSYKVKVPIMITICAAFLCVVFILLATFNVISLTVATSYSVSIAIISVFLFFFLSRPKLRSKKNELTTREDLNTKQSLTLLNEELSAKKAQLKENYSKDKDFDESLLSGLRSERFELDKQVSVGELKLDNLARELETISEQIEHDEIQIEMMQNQDSEAREGLRILAKTLEFMKKAQENVSVRFMTPMQQGFGKYFNQLSDKEVALDINFNASVQTGVGGKEFEYLSQGYRDIVSVCKRLTLIENVYKYEKPFIIMDDPFVNLDERNFNIMKQILIDFSKVCQIIYLNCHEKTSLK